MTYQDDYAQHILDLDRGEERKNKMTKPDDLPWDTCQCIECALSAGKNEHLLTAWCKNKSCNKCKGTGLARNVPEATAREMWEIKSIIEWNGKPHNENPANIDLVCGANKYLRHETMVLKQENERLVLERDSAMESCERYSRAAIGMEKENERLKKKVKDLDHMLEFCQDQLLY